MISKQHPTVFIVALSIACMDALDLPNDEPQEHGLDSPQLALCCPRIGQGDGVSLGGAHTV